MHGEESRLSIDLAQALGRVFKGYGDEEEVVEEEVLEGVDFSYENSKFDVHKAPQ
jgi:hypothetical protein